MASSRGFKLTNYDGGLAAWPRPMGAGTITFTEEGRWQLHWPAKKSPMVWKGELARKHEFIEGDLDRYPLSVEPTGPASCRVVVHDSQEQGIAGQIELPDTSQAQLQSAIDSAVTARAQRTQEAAQRTADIAARKARGEWWAEVNPTSLSPVMRINNLKGKGSLELSGDGLAWSPRKGQGVRFPWNTLGKLVVGQLSTKGKQRQLGGFVPAGTGEAAPPGPASAKRRSSYRIIRIIDGAGTNFDFATPASRAQVEAILTPVARAMTARDRGAAAAAEADKERMRREEEAVRKRELDEQAAAMAAAVNQAPAYVADEIRKLAELRQEGLLTEDEFIAQKRKLLA